MAEAGKSLRSFVQALNERSEFRACHTGPLNEHEAKPMSEFSGIGFFGGVYFEDGKRLEGI
ncbi:MAG: hypothetical protein ILP08_02150 [Lachnospiraceae bacterium]|nr:hypothetical protein [Lachnospiraceae bacterium]